MSILRQEKTPRHLPLVGFGLFLFAMKIELGDEAGILMNVSVGESQIITVPNRPPVHAYDSKPILDYKSMDPLRLRHAKT